jgi:aromatic-L-amino-acid decarboxylase
LVRDPFLWVEALQDMIRRHVDWAEELAALIDANSEFELVTRPVLSLFSFRYAPGGAKDLDALNQTLVERINDDGRIYVTQTRHDDRFVIRFQVGQTSTTRTDVMVAWEVIRELAATLPRAIEGSARAVS